ncbi:MAG: hypothetical protein KAJ90_03965 [Desulfobacterales bacterium]|nr:hypothetical protein [Desulfobacterales bacterium]
MEVWFIVSCIGNVVGIVSFAVQLTLWLNRNKKDKQLQYVIKSIGDVALTKSLAWRKQIELATQVNVQSTNEIALIQKAADEFEEISRLAHALECSVNTDSSATKDALEKLHENREIYNQVKSQQ